MRVRPSIRSGWSLSKRTFPFSLRSTKRYSFYEYIGNSPGTCGVEIPQQGISKSSLKASVVKFRLGSKTHAETKAFGAAGPGGLERSPSRTLSTRHDIDILLPQTHLLKEPNFKNDCQAGLGFFVSLSACSMIFSGL